MTFSTLTYFFLLVLWGGDSLESSPHEECSIYATGPDYYTIDLVSTKRVPGSGQASGKGEVYFATTPFGISLTDDGSYLYNIDISVDRLRAPKKGIYVAWLTTPQIDQVIHLGPLDEQNQVKGSVEWNKFLVVITLEPQDDPEAQIWEGPVVLRGISRSGLMHTMAGHGPFEDEPCALYGY